MLSTAISPPWRFTIEYVIERPSPEPLSPFVEKNGSKIRRWTASGMPMPVSWTVTTAVPPSPGRVVIVSVPPSTIASIALRMRFVMTSVSAAGRPLIGGICPTFSASRTG